MKLFSGLEEDVQTLIQRKEWYLKSVMGYDKELIDLLDLPPHGARFASIGGEVKRGDL